jgi:hypothetical protein
MGWALGGGTRGLAEGYGQMAEMAKRSSFILLGTY